MGILFSGKDGEEHAKIFVPGTDAGVSLVHGEKMIIVLSLYKYGY